MSTTTLVSNETETTTLEPAVSNASTSTSTGSGAPFLSSTAVSAPTAAPQETDSHSAFLLCTLLFFVGVAVVAKIIYSNRNRCVAPHPPSAHSLAATAPSTT